MGRAFLIKSSPHIIHFPPKEINMYINEKLSTPISHSCDVLVAGGGIAGIAAALAASRQGKSVVLLEKQYILGGLGTSGLITIYKPLCDGMGHQVSFGIAEELLRLSIKHGAEGRCPENWLFGRGERDESTDRFEVQFNPSLFAVCAEQLLIENGVKILYGTYAVATAVEDGKIKAVITESKSGRRAIAARSVVDATGDCDIAFMSGARTAVNEKGNILAAWHYSYSSDGYKLNTLGFSPYLEVDASDESEEGKLKNFRFSGLDSAELSEAVELSHKMTLSDILKRKEADAEYAPTTIATIPQVRMTRRLVGEYIMKKCDAHRYIEDSVGLVGDWRRQGPVYEVPFSSLYSREVKNLVCAGRCTSVDDEMWDIMRVIPCCAVTGEAAGIAAALGEDMASLDIAAFQAVLKEKGIILHKKDIYM